MATVGELLVKFGADVADLKTGVDAAVREATRANRAITEQANGIKDALRGAFAIGSLVEFGRELVTQTMESERNVARLTSAFRNAGGLIGVSLEDIRHQAERLSSQTLFDDDQVQGAAARLATFRNISGETFTRTIDLAADLATQLGTDLPEVITKMGKALQDPEHGMTALQKAGIQLTGANKELYDSMARINDVAGQQRAILDEIQERVGGSAAGQNVGLLGAITQLKKAWDDLLKGVGRGPLGDFITTEARGYAGLIGGLIGGNYQVNPSADEVRAEFLRNARRMNALKDERDALPESAGTFKRNATAEIQQLQAYNDALAEQLKAMSPYGKKGLAATSPVAPTEAVFDADPVGLTGLYKALGIKTETSSQGGERILAERNKAAEARAQGTQDFYRGITDTVGGDLASLKTLTFAPVKAGLDEWKESQLQAQRAVQQEVFRFLDNVRAGFSSLGDFLKNIFDSLARILEQKVAGDIAGAAGNGLDRLINGFAKAPRLQQNVTLNNTADPNTVVSHLLSVLSDPVAKMALGGL